MDLNDLLSKHKIDPSRVLVMRHRPYETLLRKMLPWIAAEKPDLFNAYQSSQPPHVEKAMTKASHILSCIGVEARSALFVGLYAIAGWREIDCNGWWRIRENRQLHEAFGMLGFDDPKGMQLWFKLVLEDRFYPDWKGRMVIGWPGLERSWWRWAERNAFPVISIAAESQFEQPMASCDELVLTWSSLKTLPSKWAAALREWRGIYFIFDERRKLGYVGAAYGESNILGRWLNYSKSGHGGNVGLKASKPGDLRFTILERVSPDMPEEEVIRREVSWKTRLHTREFGLNRN